MSVDPGLCAGCRHARRLESGRGSVFWRCAEHDRDPRWSKYPRLPVLRCERFAPETGGVSGGPRAG